MLVRSPGINTFYYLPLGGTIYLFYRALNKYNNQVYLFTYFYLKKVRALKKAVLVLVLVLGL